MNKSKAPAAVAAVGRTFRSADKVAPVGRPSPPHGEGGRSADAGGVSRLPDDQLQRDFIEREFDLNLLVEAGAGSGKTRSLARRMAAGIAAGKYQIEHMAAVTFTRKAAAELRGRFQLALEDRLTELSERDGTVAVGRTLRSADKGEMARLEHALSNLERFYAGTIHAFCAHLLRERPVESGIAPGFTELDEAEDIQRREEAWRDYIAAARASGKSELLDLLAAGVKASQLDKAFKTVCLYEEVTFPAPIVARPDISKVWRDVRKFGKALTPLIPPKPDPLAKCSVLPKAQEFVDRLENANETRIPDLLRLLELWDNKSGVVLKWWAGNGPAARALVEKFRTDVVGPFLTAWREYMYHLCVTVLMEARDYARADRRRRNALNYGDLLQIAARVLRENPIVRRALQQKFKWLFVDEFQDTDPVQAEIVLLLAGEPADGTPQPNQPSEPSVGTPRRNPPSEPLRPGALFVVGDPKQSIYRFRRADIDIYARMKRLIVDSGGKVVPLTTNFRSVPEICTWANGIFEKRFPKDETTHAPKFEPLKPFRTQNQNQNHSAEPSGGTSRRNLPAERDGGIRVLPIPATVDRSEVPQTEAAAIARYIRCEVDAGRRKFGDFLILTKKKKPLATYASALEALQIPTEVSGAGAFGDSEEVRDLSLLLRVLADPQDTVTLVGVLRGPFFGLSDQELFEYVNAGNRLWLFAGDDGTGAAAVGRTFSDAAVGRNFPPHGEATAVRRSPTSESSGEGGSSADKGARGGSAIERVEAAISFLRGLYHLTRILPPAAAVDRILEATGYLALAACTPSGAAAGDLLHAIDRIRQVSEDGGTLMNAVQALEDDAEGSSEVDSLPLEPGRSDVVRLMNLHKAKGLEAPVVFLADPCGGYPLSVEARIVRKGASADGYFQLCEHRENSWKDRIVAQPQNWTTHVTAEQAYLTAEEDRLLYVAATRARDLLVVGRWLNTGNGGNKAWTVLSDSAATATPLPMPNEPDTRATPLPDVAAATFAAADLTRAEQMRAAVAHSWSVTSVTAEARHIAAVVRKADGPADDPSRTVTQDTPAHRADAGMAWGKIIHGLLEHAMLRENATRNDLQRLGMWLTVEQPQLRTVLDGAVALVLEVARAGFWREAMASSEKYVETPFATAETTAVLLGVIDLTFRWDDDWKIVDYKTDIRPEANKTKYQQQVEQYVYSWQRISHTKTSGSVHVIASTGVVPQRADE